MQLHDGTPAVAGLRVVAVGGSGYGNYAAGDTGVITNIKPGDPVVCWDHSQQEHQTSRGKLISLASPSLEDKRKEWVVQMVGMGVLKATAEAAAAASTALDGAITLACRQTISRSLLQDVDGGDGGGSGGGVARVDVGLVLQNLCKVQREDGVSATALRTEKTLEQRSFAKGSAVPNGRVVAVTRIEAPFAYVHYAPTGVHRSTVEGFIQLKHLHGGRAGGPFYQISLDFTLNFTRVLCKIAALPPWGRTAICHRLIGGVPSPKSSKN
jgi:hypothetical protein